MVGTWAHEVGGIFPVWDGTGQALPALGASARPLSEGAYTVRSGATSEHLSTPLAHEHPSPWVRVDK